MEPVQCKAKCGKYFTLKQNMKKHFRTFHEDDSKKERLRCPHCEKTFGPDSNHNLKKHIASKHEHKKLTCDTCKIDFTLPDALVTHKKNKHGSEKGVKQNCDRCDYQTMTKQNLRTHIQRMHRDRDFNQETLNSYKQGSLEQGEQLSTFNIELEFEKLHHKDFQNTTNQKKFEIIKTHMHTRKYSSCNTKLQEAHL